MTEEQLNNIDKPQGWDVPVPAQEAIHAINRLLWSDDVIGDDYAEAMVVKAYLVDTLPNTPVPVKHSKTIPVMETTIEGAQRRIESVIDWYAGCDENPWGTDLDYIAVFLDSVGDEMAAISSSCNSLHGRYVDALNAIDEWKARLDQLQSDFDSVDTEAANHLADKIRMAGEIDEWKDNFEAVSTASTRRLEEKIELQKEIDRLREENEALRKGNLNNLHAAHDNR